MWGLLGHVRGSRRQDDQAQWGNNELKNHGSWLPTPNNWGHRSPYGEDFTDLPEDWLLVHGDLLICRWERWCRCGCCLCCCWWCSCANVGVPVGVMSYVCSMLSKVQFDFHCVCHVPMAGTWRYRWGWLRFNSGSVFIISDGSEWRLAVRWASVAPAIFTARAR